MMMDQDLLIVQLPVRLEAPWEMVHIFKCWTEATEPSASLCSQIPHNSLKSIKSENTLVYSLRPNVAALLAHF
jgi:hypothetical protein